jgi:Co/Zn/Cd efflux system component
MQKNRVLLVIFLNLLIVAFELVVGYKSNSTSLIIDAFHNLGDVLAVIVSFVAIIFAAKAATECMTFGYIKAEMMAGFVNSAFLCVTMAVLFFEAIEKLLNPTPVASLNVAITAFVALIANGLSAYLLHKNGFVHHSHDHADACCAHDYKHHEDLIDSVHDVHLYSPSSKENFFSAHLVFKENKPLDEIENILEKIRHSLEHLGITHTILQPETIKYAQEHHLCTSH